MYRYLEHIETVNELERMLAKRYGAYICIINTVRKNGNRGRTYVTLHARDVGKVIGANGRNIKALAYWTKCEIRIKGYRQDVMDNILAGYKEAEDKANREWEEREARKEQWREKHRKEEAERKSKPTPKRIRIKSLFGDKLITLPTVPVVHGDGWVMII